MSKPSGEPFEQLGQKLKSLRKQWKQTIGEVSATLEIDEQMLEQIEAGQTIPTENLLEMLISHFVLSEDQAKDLRAMADQYQQQASDGLVNGLEDMLMKQIVMYAPDGGRTVYTDSMQATVNKNGVVLQFMQAAGGQNDQPITISRVGMSQEHAERMIEVLKSTLSMHARSSGTSTNILPAPKKKDK